MNSPDLKKKLTKSHQRFVFSRFRRHLVYFISPIFLLFSAVDYLYRPDLAFKWFLLRSTFVILAFVTLKMMSTKFVRKYIVILASAFIVLACNLVNFMIHESGGANSIYITGVILCSVAGLQLFKFNRFQSTIIQCFCFIPTIALLFVSLQKENLNFILIQSMFLIGMILLSFVYGSSDDQNVELFMTIKEKMKAEIEKLNRTERLKKFFPPILRKQIEENPDTIGQKSKIKNLIIGFADITNSTQIANVIDLEKDWQLKEEFLEAATRLALKNELVVLTHMGDGFLFLGNYVNEIQWQESVINFFRDLINDYERIYANVVGMTGQIESGIKFGLARGDTILGFLGSDQSYFTAIGPAVNLASRVCGAAKNNEMVVTKDLWSSMSGLVNEFHLHENFYVELKGFPGKFELFRISRALGRSVDVTAKSCATCSGLLILENNEDGFLDYVCPKCSGASLVKLKAG